MKTTATERALDAVFERYCDEVDAIVAQVRRDHLIPFCEKHALRFVSGMGSWVFVDQNDTSLFEATERVGGDWDMREAGLGYLHSGEETKRYRCKRLLRLLSTVPDGLPNNSLGSMMGDYSPAQREVA